VRWGVSVVARGGAPTVAEVRDAAHAELREKARANPLVAAIFEAFPDAKFGEIRTAEELAAEAAGEALAEVDDEWDPFEGE